MSAASGFAGSGEPGVPAPRGTASRRAVLGAAGLAGAAGLLGAGAPGAHAAPAAPAPRREPAGFSTAAAGAALRRVLPRHHEQFELRAAAPAADPGRERFRVSGSTGRIVVEATSTGVLLTGAHWYLKYVCGAHIAWNGSSLPLPDRLPAPARPLERTTALPHRFALNDTSDGYTAPYADWAYWERMIDVLALHGCNEVLVIAGMEAVYQRTLLDAGYSDEEARAWLPAPSHQPWWLLQNLSGYGGPLSARVIAERAALGRRIADRLRELGMAPVLPGYYGHVPEGFAARAGGDAHTVPQGDWHGFRRPDWLDPRTDAFAGLARSFYRHQRDVLGPAAHFKMDLLHEGGTAGDVPVPDAARGVQRALSAAHPGATWVILGWEANPLPELLDAVDKEHMLIVDGVSDRYSTVTDRERDWGGTPYAFGTIPNFGGRTTIGARTHIWNEKFFAWRDKPGSALAGTAYLPEAADRDPAAFELFSELAWHDTAPDRAAWFQGYADLRYGGADPAARAAWSALRETAYEQHAVQRSDPHDSLFAARPDLAATRASVFAPSALTYDPGRFDAALDGLLGVRETLRRSAAYRYDLVDVARQALTHRARQYLPQLRAAYERGDLTTFRRLSVLWLNLMRLLDDVTAAHEAFLLGPWVRDARARGTTDAERAEFERTARALLTVWGSRATSDGGTLHDYANREWHGLVGGFYLPRWQRWLDELEDALREQRAPVPVDWFAFEEPWTLRTGEEQPLRATADAHRTASRVRDVLAAAPYQGTLAVTARPAAFPPGGRARVTAEFTNVNGLRATGPVGLVLSGVGSAHDTVTLPSVPAAGSATAHWDAEAPATPLDRPLRPLPYRITTAYGPQDGDRISTVQEGTLFEAGPLDGAWRTVSSNDAVFGQLGDRYAVHGGGADLWKGTTEFGALYRPGVLRDGTAVTVAVRAQEDTGAWARAGIIMRDSLAAEGSSGLLDLAVTPANGVVLSWDSDGDGALDTYRRITGVTAPVTLRLGRSGTAYTGQCSTDGGATWRTVATVALRSAVAAQDAGIFMSAANGGDGRRGTVEFDGWSSTG